MIRQLAHTCFTTYDLDATLHFYRDILGLPVTFRFLRNDEVIGCYFSCGGNTFLECFLRPGGEEAIGAIKHFCLEVEDIDALENTLTQAGVPVRGKRQGADHTFQLWCTDPNGIDIEFQQYGPESCQLRGTDCLVNW